MKKHALVAEGTIVRLTQAAQQAFRNRDYDECFETLERARRMTPANTKLLMDIGGLRLLRYENALAAESFDRAIKLSPKKTAALEAAGRYCLESSSFNLARQYLEQAAAHNDVSAEGLANLCRTYERLRRKEEAAAAAERAIQLDPHSPTAVLACARMDHLMGRDAEAEARLRAFTTSREEVVNRVRAAYELGAILDRQGRYDEAMAVFQQAKILQQPYTAEKASDLKRSTDRLKALMDSLTPDILKRWMDSLPSYSPALRLAFLGGHPRSGTTLLEQVVDSHPEIISAEESEVFNSDVFFPIIKTLPPTASILEALENATPLMIQKTRNNYLSRTETFLGEPVGRRLLVDKNPSLMFHPAALARVFPEMKFLIALRDPRDVCMSCFMMPAPVQQIASAWWLSLEILIREYIVLMGSWRRLSAMLPNPQLEVRYEDMVDDLEPVARRTLEFLGVTWDAKVLGFDEHARQKAVRSPTYSDVTNKVFKRAVGRWRNYQKYFEPYLATIEPLAKELGYE